MPKARTSNPTNDDLDDLDSEDGLEDLDLGDEDGADASAKDNEIAELKAQLSARDKQYNDLTGLYHQQSGRLDELSARFNAGAADEAAKREARPEITEPSRAEIAAALAEGEYEKAAELMEQKANAAAMRSTRLLHDTAIEPLRKGFQDVGLPTVAAMQVDRVVDGLNAQAKEVYAKNRDAILGHINQLPENMRLSPNAIKATIATHFGATYIEGDAFERAVQDEVDRRLRGDVAPNVTPSARGITRHTNGPNAEPNWRDIFGAEAEAAANQFGGWDGYVSKMFGYKNMMAYAKATGVIQ